MYLYGTKVPKSAYCNRSLSVHQWDLCDTRSCTSPCVCYFEDKWTPRHPATCKFRKSAPSTVTAATSVDKNSIICAIFTGCKHIESHLLCVCLPPVFVRLVWILGSGGGFLRLAKSSRVRQVGAGPPSHNSCSVIVASEDSVDFWEGTVEKYTSFSKLPAQAAGTPKNRGCNWPSSCHC